MTRRRDAAAISSRPSGGLPWVVPTAVILPPLRGSMLCNCVTVGYVCFAHCTHGWGPFAATRLCGALTGAMVGGGLTASYAHDVRLQAVAIVSRSARMTRRRDAAATLSRPSGGMPWVAPTAVILPPLRGSYVNIVFTVGSVRVAHRTHGWGPFAAMRLCGSLTGAMVGGGLPPATLTMFACRRLRLCRAPRE